MTMYDPLPVPPSNVEISPTAEYSLPGLLRLPSHPPLTAAGTRLLSHPPSSAVYHERVSPVLPVRRWQNLTTLLSLLFYRCAPILMTGAGIICLWIESESFSVWPRLLAFGLLSVFCLLYLFGLWSRDRLTRLITMAMLVVALLASLGFLYQSTSFLQQTQPDTEYVTIQNDKVLVQGTLTSARIARIWSVGGSGQVVYYFQVVGKDTTIYRVGALLGSQLKAGQVVSLHYQAEQGSANSDIVQVTSLQISK